MAKNTMKSKDADSPNINHMECIDCLITETKSVYWRVALLDMIKPHFQHEPIKTILAYLISTIRSAIAACHNGPGSYVDIDLISVPNNFDLNNWRRILIGINLELCEPDTNKDIKLIGVSITQSTVLQALEGLYTLLQSLYVMHWDVLQMVIYMEYKKASVLYETLTDCVKGYSIPTCYSDTILELYGAKTQVMGSLGFKRNTQSQITWSHPEGDIQPVLHTLHALYRIPVGVQATGN